MIRSLLLFACFFVLAFPSFSQDEDDEPLDEDDRKGIPVEVLSDNPEDMRIFRVQLPIWELTGSKMNSSIYDANVGIFAQLNNKWLFTAQYSYQAGDRIAPDTFDDSEGSGRESMFSIYENTHANSLFVSGTYFFRERRKKTEMYVHLKHVGDADLTLVTQGTQLIRTGIRLGVTQGVSWYCMNNANIHGAAADDPSIAPRDFNYSSMTTMMEYTNLHVGLSVAKLTNLLVNVERFGKRRASDFSVMNFDLLFSVRNNLDNVYAYTGMVDGYSNLSTYQEFNIQDHNKKLRVGASVGAKYFPLTGIACISWEVGYFPGLLTNINAYVKVGASFFLGKRLKA